MQRPIRCITPILGCMLIMLSLSLSSEADSGFALSNTFTLDTRDIALVPIIEAKSGFALSNIFTLDTRDIQLSWDVDGSGVVDILDLVNIANAFGTSGKGLPADVNGDGIVDIFDLALAAAHFGEVTNPRTPASPQLPTDQHADMIERWLAEARSADDGSEIFRRGIAILERLLNMTVPEQTALLQNYPNPFNPETWIPYQLNKASEVSITIYDVLGRMVKRLDLGYQQAGMYRTKNRAAHWDGRNESGEFVASGVYFVELKTEKYRQVRRIVLLK